MHPSGAKAQFFLALDGMAKAMPLQSTIYETGSMHFPASKYIDSSPTLRFGSE
jgi:hypothetical protein